MPTHSPRFVALRKSSPKDGDLQRGLAFFLDVHVSLNFRHTARMLVLCPMCFTWSWMSMLPIQKGTLYDCKLQD